MAEPATAFDRAVDHDTAICEQLAREVPSFWDYFYARHPKFATIRTAAGPIGWMPVAEVYEAIGDTITAYVRGEL